MFSKTKNTKPTFSWKPKEWKNRRMLHADILLMHKTDSTQTVIVRKVVKQEERNGRPVKHFEIRALASLPNCNRIVPMLGYADNDPQKGWASIIYEWYPMGDLYNWKKENFDAKNFKPIPESYIWRFFIQMTQALGFIHNELGPDRHERHCIIHRDIKPKNVLVVSNGSTYPSFKLHDFGCAMFRHPAKSYEEAYCGTFEWQPPENPIINTAAADVWAVGACVHFMAVGKAPIGSIDDFVAQERIQANGKSIAIPSQYTSVGRRNAARVPRVVTNINLSKEEQIRQGTAPRAQKPEFIPEYSDELNSWMHAVLIQAGERATVPLLLERMVPEATKIIKLLSRTSGLVDLEITF